MPKWLNNSRFYLTTFVSTIAACALAFALWGFAPSRDHFASQPLDGEAGWYRDYDDQSTREVQDRDIIFHNIGNSIDAARAADVILLGHSVLGFGIDDSQVAQFAREHNVRIFNLFTPGIASGAFIRKVIKRWDIRPKIWIVNATDIPANFFNDEMDDLLSTGKSSALQIVNTPRPEGYWRVIKRNVRWAIEDLVAGYVPGGMAKLMLRYYGSGISIWRSAVTGNYSLKQIAYYWQQAPLIKPNRDQTSCHVLPWEIEKARAFLADIGGTVVLTNLPELHWCPLRVNELAAALGLETIMPPDAEYQSIDTVHMNSDGARKFTHFLIEALQRTAAFKMALPAAALAPPKN